MTTTGVASDKRADAPRQKRRERRRHRRISVNLSARFLRADGSEHQGVLENVSVGGALVRADAAPAAREKIILYIEQLGRFEAVVVRSDAECFAVKFEQRAQKAARTADALIWLMNRKGTGDDKRTAPRVRQHTQSLVRYEDGTEAACVILDISLTGASLDVDPKPPVGTNLVLGRTRARVMRHHEQGIGVMFLKTGPEGASKVSEVIKELKAG